MWVDSFCFLLTCVPADSNLIVRLCRSAIDHRRHSTDAGQCAIGRVVNLESAGTLFNTIVRDTRNIGVRLLSYEEIGERRFGGWTMGQVNIAKVNPSLLLKYATKATLDPFNCSGHASMALLNELIATAAVVNRNS